MSCVNVIPDRYTSHHWWEDCRASCNLLQAFPFMLLESSSQCPPWILLMELSFVLVTGNGFSLFCSSLLYIWQFINSAPFPTPPTFPLYWIFLTRLCFEIIFSFVPLLFFMIPELKFGHRATTPLSTPIAAADRNWGMASYVLKTALYLSSSIIFTFFSSKRHNTVKMAFEAL